MLALGGLHLCSCQPPIASGTRRFQQLLLRQWARRIYSWTEPASSLTALNLGGEKSGWVGGTDKQPCPTASPRTALAPSWAWEAFPAHPFIPNQQTVFPKDTLANSNSSQLSHCSGQPASQSGSSPYCSQIPRSPSDSCSASQTHFPPDLTNVLLRGRARNPVPASY